MDNEAFHSVSQNKIVMLEPIKRGQLNETNGADVYNHYMCKPHSVNTILLWAFHINDRNQDGLKTRHDNWRLRCKDHA